MSSRTVPLAALLALALAGAVGATTVARFVLVDADTDVDRRVLTDGDVVDLAVDGRRLNIRAEVGGAVESVRFDLDGALSVESAAPYALAGDRSGDYAAWTPSLGAHRLVATAFARDGAAGPAGGRLAIDFRVVDSSTAPPTVPPPTGGTGVVTGELRKWHRVSVTFAGPSTDEGADPNPFLDYRLEVEFTHDPTGRTIVVPGFYAADGDAAESGATGGDRWRAHLAPDAVGRWSYVARFRAGAGVAASPSPTAGQATAFDGATGSFVVDGTDKAAPDNRGRGMLRYVGRHHLRFAETGRFRLKGGADSPENFLAYADFDGTRDTGGLATPGLTGGLHRYAGHVADHRPGDPTWRGGRGRGIVGAINYLAGHGINSIYFLTYNLDGGDGRDTWPWTDPGQRLRFDVSKLDQWEIVFGHMDARGVGLHVVTQETENDGVLDGGRLGDIRRIYYRELVARFAHHLDVTWNLGEENDHADADRLAFARAVRALDPYDHPITVHTHYGRPEATYGGLLGAGCFEATSIQGDAADYHRWAVDFRRRSAAAGRPWVVHGDEQGPAVDRSMKNLDRLRKDALWGNLMGGGAGVEWYFGYQGDFGDLQSDDWRRAEPLWRMTGHALRFFEDLPFADMTPDDGRTPVPSDHVLSLPGRLHVVYLPDGGSPRLTVGAGTWRVRWFDPRRGGPLVDGSTTTVRGPGAVALGSPPSEPRSDWVVRVERLAGSPGAPSVSLVRPPAGAVFGAGATIRIAAVASDPGGAAVTRIDFTADGRPVGAAVATPFGHDWTGAPVGRHRIVARATFADGRTADSAPADVFVAPPAPGPSIVRFVLVDGSTSRDLRVLADGDVVRLSTDGRRLNIRAEVLGAPGSVAFDLDGRPFRTENVAPYALAGDRSGNYLSWEPSIGRRVVRAVPWSAAGGRGAPGAGRSIAFRVVP